MEQQSRTVERIIARLASRAHGVVSRAELLAAGVSAEEIRGRIAKGSLIVEFPGVYRAGHAAPSIQARYTAAVKACGEGAMLSGLAAAYHLGLVRGRRAPAPEVTTPTERNVRGIATRRSRRIDRRDVMTHDRIRVSTAARTLVDIAARLSEEELGRACHQAGVRHKATPRQVEAVLQRRPSTPGATRLRRICRGETRISLSALERRFLARLREANLPLPDETNRYAGTKRVDCRWVAQRLTVELDSYTFHNSRHAFEQDRKREREAYTRGDAIRRYTWGDVFEHPGQMLAELRTLLPQADAPPRRRVA